MSFIARFDPERGMAHHACRAGLGMQRDRYFHEGAAKLSVFIPV